MRGHRGFKLWQQALLNTLEGVYVKNVSPLEYQGDILVDDGASCWRSLARLHQDNIVPEMKNKNLKNFSS